MNDIKTLKRTDYTHYLRPRQARVLESAKVRRSTAADTMTISIRVHLPDYSNWSTYGFIRRYPYISLAIAAVAFIVLVLTGDVTVWLWHLIHKGGKG